jgi:hypothetical protein
METVNLVISKEKFDLLYNSCLVDYSEVREVIVKDELFKDDTNHKELVKAVIKAKEKLKEYEFKKRNNIR